MNNVDNLTQQRIHALQEGKLCQNLLLYVEDNAANLLLVKQLIARRDDVQLLSAINGPMGIQMAQEHLPDVILMDINLPGIDGFETLKLLRDDAATAHIPVIALSSNAFSQDIEKGIGAGFFHYLTKPYQIDVLMDVIDAGIQYAAIIRRNRIIT